MFAPDEFPLMFNASVAALCIVTGKYDFNGQVTNLKFCYFSNFAYILCNKKDNWISDDWQGSSKKIKSKVNADLLIKFW